jgi:predicted TIM-barrel fold metal-dependent hydrolase
MDCDPSPSPYHAPTITSRERDGAIGVEESLMTLVTLENPLVKGRGSANLRRPQERHGQLLPAGTRVVSADGHWEVCEDIFVERFPAAMKDRAPRVWFDGYWHHGAPQIAPPIDVEAQLIEERLRAYLVQTVGTGAWDMELRNRDLDAEGVEKEILYPHSLLGFIRNPDLELQEQVYRTYNEYIAEVGADTPGRYYGVGICSNWWEPAKAHGAIRQIVDLGLRTFMVPSMNPGKTADGKPINYGGPEMDAFWSEAADAGLPISFHVGENVSLFGRGSVGSSLLITMSPFRKAFGELVFGGVFDRHPNLQIVFAEGGLPWIPTTLQDAEAILDVHYTGLDLIPERRPSEYWQSNCYATFQNDLLGLSMVDYIGADRLMWAGDYPHNESTCGFGWDSMVSVVDVVSEDDARKILGGTAIELYRLDD